MLRNIIPFSGAIIFFAFGYIFNKEFKNEDISSKKSGSKKKSLIKAFSDVASAWEQRPKKEKKTEQINSNFKFLRNQFKFLPQLPKDEKEDISARKKVNFKKISILSLIICTIVGIIIIYGSLWALISLFFSFTDGFQGRLNVIAGILTIIAALFGFIDRPSRIIEKCLSKLEMDISGFSDWTKEMIANSSFYFIIGMFMIYSGIYIYSNLCINQVDDSFFPLTTIVAGLSVWNIGLSFLQKKGYDLSFPFITIAFILLILFASLSNFLNNNLHEIKTQEAARTELSNFPTHFRKWSKNKSIPIANSFNAKDTSLVTPIFIVTAQGGGSRAAAWTYRVLSALDRETDGRFSKNCYAISSISGGTFGSSVFLSNLRNQLVSGNPALPSDSDVINTVFAQNYLASAIISITGKDFFNTFFGIFKVDDRDRVLEKKRTDRIIKSFKDNNIKYHGTYEDRYLDYWYEGNQLNESDMPLFFPNTTWVEKGARAVSAPISLDSFDFPKTLHITHEILQDSIRVNEDRIVGRKEIEFRSAAHLSSRFPFINSAGEIEGLGHFVDGGYYDNIGGQTTKAIIENLNKYISENDTLNNHQYKIILIRIYNGSKESKPIRQANINQIAAPIQGILNSPFTGHTEYSTESLELRKEYGRIDEIYDFQLDEKMKMKLENEKSTIEVKFPLARYLSKRAAKGIYFSIEDSENEDEFELINTDSISENNTNIVIGTAILFQNNANINNIKSMFMKGYPKPISE